MTSVSIQALINTLNILAGGGMIVGAIGHFIFPNFGGVIVGIYLLIFGIGVIILEFQLAFQPFIAKYAGFMRHYMGRGILYILLAVLALDFRLLLAISGGMVASIGVIFCVLAMFPSIELCLT